MFVGIVGHEAAKFTPETERAARELIRHLIIHPDAVVVSGGCHLGGIDIWAEEEADRLGRPKIIFRPKNLRWEGGYKQRNLQIAAQSDTVHSIVVRTLPENYTDMLFKACCYHCNTTTHIKSGGCWTARKCARYEIHEI